jgi:hypothetical protein
MDYLRRDFTKHVLTFGLIAVCAPHLAVRPAKAIPFWWVTALRTGALWLANRVIAPTAVGFFVSWLKQRFIVASPPAQTYHDQFSYPVMFADSLQPQQTLFGQSYFGIHRYPATAANPFLGRVNEYNLGEVAAVKNDANPYFYPRMGPGPVVLRNIPVPETERMPPSMVDRAAFEEQTLREGVDPRPINLMYVRFFRNLPSMLPLTGYGWVSQYSPRDQGLFVVPRIHG